MLWYIPDREASEDLFHEIMIKVWNNLDSFHNKSKITTWIYRISVNTALLYKQKEAKSTYVKIENLNFELASEDTLEQKKELEKEIG